MQWWLLMEIDLGVEMDPEEVPPIQSCIINKSHRMGLPVILATQMFESINSSPSQTRAEISDIATAIYSGVDATMLSAESALGQYPFEAVSIMSQTFAHVVSEPYCQRWLGDDKKRTTIDAISAAAKNTAEYSCATTIVLFTDNFQSVVHENIFENKEFDNSVMSKAAKDIVKEHKFAKVGDNIVVLNDQSEKDTFK